MLLLLVIGLGLSIIIGLLLSVSEDLLAVEEDPRLNEVIALLPNINCGACGNPGCKGMAESILREDARLGQCKPGNQEMREEIAEYLRTTPNEDGDFTKVKM